MAKNEYGFTREQFDNALRLINDFQDKADKAWENTKKLHASHLYIEEHTFKKWSSECAHYNGKVNAISAALHCLGLDLTRVQRKDGTCYYTYEGKKKEDK